jgi:hypothetical protein
MRCSKLFFFYSSSLFPIIFPDEDDWTMTRNHFDESSEEDEEARLIRSSRTSKIPSYPSEMRRELDQQCILADLSQNPHYGFEKTNRHDFFRGSDEESGIGSDDSIQEAQDEASENDEILDTDLSFPNFDDRELEKQRVIDELKEIERDER